jgi:hypothetical protein
MTMFTGAGHWVLSNWIHSTLSSQSPLDPFWPHSSVHTSVSLVVSFLRAIPPKPCRVYTFLSPRRSTCPTHLIRLNFFCLMILVDEYKSWSLSLCNFLRSHVTSFSFCLHSQDCGFVYFNIYIARQEGGRPNYRNHLHDTYNMYNRMVASRCPTPQHEGHILPTVRDCLFAILPATLHIWRPSAIWRRVIPWTWDPIKLVFLLHIFLKLFIYHTFRHASISRGGSTEGLFWSGIWKTCFHPIGMNENRA